MNPSKAVEKLEKSPSSDAVVRNEVGKAYAVDLNKKQQTGTKGIVFGSVAASTVPDAHHGGPQQAEHEIHTQNRPISFESSHGRGASDSTEFLSS